MSKKIYLLIFAFTPLIIGYLHNLIYRPLLLQLLRIPIINLIIWYGIPILVAYFWFWVGGKFAQSNIKILVSIILGNYMGIICLGIYFWQFNYTSANLRNSFLASSSLFFSSNVGVFVTHLAYLFEPDKTHIGMVTLNAIQILGLVLMIILFTAGYIYKKYKIKSSKIVAI